MRALMQMGKSHLFSKEFIVIHGDYKKLFKQCSV